MFHGTDSEIKTLNANMMFLTHDIDAAKAYGNVVHVISVNADANIGNESDLREIVEGLGYDWSEERPWGWLEYKKVRAAAVEAGFDGFEGDDCLPGTDGSSRDDQHDFTAIFNPAASCTLVGLA